MATLGQLLKSSPLTTLPRTVERLAMQSVPSLPKVSTVLDSVADSLPAGPDLAVPQMIRSKMGGFSPRGRLVTPKLDRVFRGPKEAAAEVKASLQQTVASVTGRPTVTVTAPVVTGPTYIPPAPAQPSQLYFE
jgi:hypothetical protein